MDPDDEVCLCFHVSLRKLVHFMEREEPTVPSQLSECLGAGTGCHWCVPFLQELHTQWSQGCTPHIPVPKAEYSTRRSAYRHAKGDPAP
jgi:bacterioferritin-associated ferredoxin